MARIELNRDLFIGPLRAKAAGLGIARQRKMLEVFLEHAKAEIGGELERVMATLIPDPQFHTWYGGEDIGPKGWDAVKAMYAEMFSTRSNYMELDIHALVVDNDRLVAEFTQRRILPDRNLPSGSLADALRAKGEGPDPSALYLTKGRAVVIIPFDEQCRIIGEDTFTGGAAAIRKLSEEELPEAYRAWL